MRDFLNTCINLFLFVYFPRVDMPMNDTEFFLHWFSKYIKTDRHEYNLFLQIVKKWKVYVAYLE